MGFSDITIEKETIFLNDKQNNGRIIINVLDFVSKWRREVKGDTRSGEKSRSGG